MEKDVCGKYKVGILKMDISKLEEARIKADQIITTQNQTIAQLTQRKESLEKQLKTSTVLNEKKILSEFENAFKTAKEEIDIAVPWLGKYAAGDYWNEHND